MNLPQRSDFRYWQSIPTRWGDEDRMGHINNAMYFTYDEQARITYLRSQLAEAGYEAGEGRMILARIACDFLVQINHPSTLDYGMRITRIGRSSMMSEGASFIGDVCHSRVAGVMVWFDYEKQASGPIPDAVRNQILNYEIVKPET